VKLCPYSAGLQASTTLGGAPTLDALLSYCREALACRYKLKLELKLIISSQRSDQPQTAEQASFDIAFVYDSGVH
jgi:hypothetical protein